MMKFDVIIPVAFKDYFFLERTIPYIIEEFYKLKYCSTVVYMVPRA